MHKRPHQRASLSEVLSRGFLRQWMQDRTTSPPPVVDILEQKQELLRRPLADVYLWGRGRALPSLREDLMGICVVHVACGLKHCAVVSDDGTLYTWGDNEYGQCGHGDRARLSRRRPVISLSVSVATVACGRAHTAVCSRAGELFCCGSNERGQLGVGEDSELLDSMRCLVFPPSIIAPPPAGFTAVACGEAHTLSLSAAGAVRGTRQSSPHQSSLSTLSNPRRKPWPTAAPCSIRTAALCPPGRLPVLARASPPVHPRPCIPAGSQVFGWGAAEDGRLGFDPEEGGEEEVWLARPIEGLEAAAVQLACGDCFSAVRQEQ